LFLEDLELSRADRQRLREIGRDFVEAVQENARLAP
jgi:hypothetical protein